MRESKVVETERADGTVRVGYLPGFLGFREGPLVVRAVMRLKTRPDVFLVDGHGRAHPRRFGLACHVGLALDAPTVGVAKSPFYGNVTGNNVHAPNGRVVGKVLKAGSGKPYYVSTGHRVSLRDAVRVVRSCFVGNFPAPLRAAHMEAVRLKRQHRC